MEQELVPMMVTTDAGASMAVVGRSMLLGTMKQGMSQAEIKAMQAIDMMAAKGIIEPAEQESTGPQTSKFSSKLISKKFVCPSKNFMEEALLAE